MAAGAIRLDFEYDGDALRLVSLERLKVPTSPSDPTDKYAGQSGLWVELRDRDRLVFRRVLHDARYNIEVPPQKGGRFSNVYDPLAKGAFSVFVPDRETTAELRVRGSAGPGQRTAELLRVTIP